MRSGFRAREWPHVPAMSSASAEAANHLERRRLHDDSENADERARKRQRREEKRSRKEARRQRRAERAQRREKWSSLRPADIGRSNDESGSSEEENARKEVDSDIFVWKKKNDLLRKQGVKVTAEDELRRKREIQEDLERAKVRRAQREAERAEWEAEQAKQAREREQEQNADWHRAEVSFHGTQHFLRQAIRLRENRATDADSLARNMRLDLLDVAADSRSPAEFLDDRVAEQISIAEVDALVEAVENELDCVPDFPLEGDTNAFNRRLRLRWWTNVERFLKELARSMRDRNACEAAGSSGLHSSVQKDVNDMLREKSTDQLEQMQSEISRRVEGGGGDNDAAYGEVDFWAAALRSIRSRLARVELREMTDVLAKERQRLREAQPKAQPKAQTSDARGGTSAHPEGGSSAERQLLGAEMAKGLGADEEAFAEEAMVPAKKAYVPGYLWNEKYRPRKPRYYNRVHTGYDWTKYNRTHYDHNNPPPKTVQGYKFNIFYPDLIDRSKTPQFSMSKTENPEVCIITFSAGPPYEDIAFKIVNRQWEQSHRRGYRCSFDRGVLHLWFNFQRYRYRR